MVGRGNGTAKEDRGASTRRIETDGVGSGSSGKSSDQVRINRWCAPTSTSWKRQATRWVGKERLVSSYRRGAGAEKTQGGRPSTSYFASSSTTEGTRWTGALLRTDTPKHSRQAMGPEGTLAPAQGS